MLQKLILYCLNDRLREILTYKKLFSFIISRYTNSISRGFLNYLFFNDVLTIVGFSKLLN